MGSQNAGGPFISPRANNRALRPRYINSILYVIGSHPIIAYATADASYANHADRKSHLGFTIHIGNNDAATYSYSKKSELVALSSSRVYGTLRVQQVGVGPSILN